MIKTTNEISSYVKQGNTYKPVGDAVTVSNVVTTFSDEDTNMDFRERSKLRNFVQIDIDGGVSVIVNATELKTAIDNSCEAAESTIGNYSYVPRHR